METEMAAPTPPMEVLEEVRNLMAKKANDYQNPRSTVKHAHHYRRGIDSVQDMLHQKLLRAQSLIESESAPQCEALEDTYKDLIAYASFAVCCVRGTLDGQEGRDMFMKPLSVKAHPGVPVRNVDVCGVQPSTDEEIEARYHATRHARARGLPEEKSTPPFPPAGDPAYDKEWPVDPYTVVS